jgi:hypothetical protein
MDCGEMLKVWCRGRGQLSEQKKKGTVIEIEDLKVDDDFPYLQVWGARQNDGEDEFRCRR